MSSLIKRKCPSLDFVDFRISILSRSVGLYSFLALENDGDVEIGWHRMGFDDDDDDELDVDVVELRGFEAAMPDPCLILPGSSDFLFGMMTQ